MLSALKSLSQADLVAAINELLAAVRRKRRAVEGERERERERERASARARARERERASERAREREREFVLLFAHLVLDPPFAKKKKTPKNEKKSPQKQHALGAHRAADGREIFKATPPGDGARFKGLSAEEVLVYQAVEAAGNVGIWTKELRARTNLQQPAVARMLKALEARGLVKSVRSVANGSRKVYMLSGLEPAREVTGGAWYTGHEFDSAFTVRGDFFFLFFFSPLPPPAGVFPFPPPLVSLSLLFL